MKAKHTENQLIQQASRLNIKVFIDPHQLHYCYGNHPYVNSGNSRKSILVGKLMLTKLAN